MKVAAQLKRLLSDARNRTDGSPQPSNLLKTSGPPPPKKKKKRYYLENKILEHSFFEPPPQNQRLSCSCGGRACESCECELRVARCRAGLDCIGLTAFKQP